MDPRMNDGKPQVTMRNVLRASENLDELAAGINVAAELAKKVNAAGLATACYLLSEAIGQYRKELVKFARKELEEDT